MDETRAFGSFEEFWPHYVAAHRHKATRMLHFAGTTAALGCIAGAVVFKKRWLILLAPVVGYAPSWASHFLIEKNRPEAFGHPLWALRADFVMWWKTIQGEMDAEVARVVSAREEARATAARRDAVN